MQSAILRLHVVRLSVCELMDQDHIGWKPWKLIARTISPTATPSLVQKPSTYSQGTWGKIFGRLAVGWEKWRAGAQKRQYLKRVDIEEELLWSIIWRAYMNYQRSFEMVPSPTPYGLLFPKIAGSQPPPKTSIAIISRSGKATIRTRAH